MTISQALVWLGGPIVVVATIVVAGLAARRPRGATHVREALMLTGLAPIVVAGLALAFRVEVQAPSPAWATAAAIIVAALGVIGGAPATSAVLAVAMRRDEEPGPHGGILVLRSIARSIGAAAGQERHEVLRGGATIGYLERIAVVAAIVSGHLSIVAAVIAVKGLGRFSELDNAEARERFIVGTLASMLWAAACAVLVVQPG
jgi:hypothetical protein